MSISCAPQTTPLLLRKTKTTSNDSYINLHFPAKNSNLRYLRKRRKLTQYLENQYVTSDIQITSSKSVSEEVRLQTIKASKISGCSNETIGSNKFLRTETKVRIYKTVVRPILTYETRTDPAKTRELLEVCEMKSPRRISGKTRMDRVKK